MVTESAGASSIQVWPGVSGTGTPSGVVQVATEFSDGLVHTTRTKWPSVKTQPRPLPMNRCSTTGDPAESIVPVETSRTSAMTTFSGASRTSASSRWGSPFWVRSPSGAVPGVLHHR